VDGRVPRVLTDGCLQDASPELRIDHGEGCLLADRAMHELRCGRVPSDQAASLGAAEGLRQHAQDIGDRLRREALAQERVASLLDVDRPEIGEPHFADDAGDVPNGVAVPLAGGRRERPSSLADLRHGREPFGR
jgi:hypothetical protein